MSLGLLRYFVMTALMKGTQRQGVNKVVKVHPTLGKRAVSQYQECKKKIDFCMNSMATVRKEEKTSIKVL